MCGYALEYLYFEGTLAVGHLSSYFDLEGCLVVRQDLACITRMLLSEERVTHGGRSETYREYFRHGIGIIYVSLGRIDRLKYSFLNPYLIRLVYSSFKLL